VTADRAASSHHGAAQPVLYGLARSVYTRIARLALAEKGVDYVFEHVEIFGPGGVPPEHLRRHPFGRIPVFEHDGLRVYETAAVTRYVDEAFPGPALQPADARARARMDQAIGLLDAYAYRPMVWGVFVERVVAPREGRAPDEAIVGDALPVVATCLRALADMLGTQPFLAGDRLTLADLHAAPMLAYLALAPEGAHLLEGHVELQRWLQAMRARHSMQATTSVHEAGGH
jgi:glutathione S-transferase